MGRWCAPALPVLRSSQLGRRCDLRHRLNKLIYRGTYKLPAAQTENENCVAHNGSIVPVPGRDIFVQAWYQGGLSVIDFTDSTKPTEIAFFDRGPISDKAEVLGGYWSTYWYAAGSTAPKSPVVWTCWNSRPANI